MLSFEKINSISVEEPETWRDKVFITMDIDWAVDPVIDFAIELLEKYQRKATIFVTHDSPSIRSMASNPLFEIGIHPNFNELIKESNSSTGLDKVKEIMDITGPVSSVRSHSLFQSTHILNYFSAQGIKYDCNLYLPSEANLSLKPWHHWNGMIRVPHFWEDDINFLKKKNIPPRSLLRESSIKVFDFHPMHIFLNTVDLKHYQKISEYYKDFNALKTFVNKDKPGVRDLFTKLISNTDGVHS